MAAATSIRATITKVKDGYTVTAVFEKNGRSLTLAKRSARNLVEAEIIVRSFAVHHRVPWHTVEVLYR